MDRLCSRAPRTTMKSGSSAALRELLKIEAWLFGDRSARGTAGQSSRHSSTAPLEPSRSPVWRSLVRHPGLG
jgi:hypothetical protein